MIAIACDHGGYALKQDIIEFLNEKHLDFEDFGTYSAESCDYPDFARAAAQAVSDGRCERGILICITGIGVSMVANKVRGVRCALCGDPFSAEMTRRHNDANMLAIGAGIVGKALALRIVETFIETEFEGGRHARRVEKIMDLDKN